MLVAKKCGFNHRCKLKYVTSSSFLHDSNLHSFLSGRNKKFSNILPPLVLLSDEKKKELNAKLNELKFNLEDNLAA